MTALCWTLIVLAIAWVGFAYASYPFVLWIMTRVSPRPVHRDDISPSVSVIIVVHDGAKVLMQNGYAPIP